MASNMGKVTRFPIQQDDPDTPEEITGIPLISFWLLAILTGWAALFCFAWVVVKVVGFLVAFAPTLLGEW